MNRQSTAAWLKTMEQRYEDLVVEKHTVVYGNSREQVDEFYLVCNHINYYNTRIQELQSELGINTL